jgi:hypothetical protein
MVVGEGYQVQIVRDLGYTRSFSRGENKKTWVIVLLNGRQINEGENRKI